MNQDDRNPEQDRGEKALAGWQTAFFVMMAMGAFFLATSPSSNVRQLVFRVSIIVIGVIGSIAVQILKRRSGS